MRPDIIREMRQAIRREGLDGWLFCNFRHRDRLADELLGIDSVCVNSRLWFYALPVYGEALVILHDIERNCLRADLPGQRLYYRGREELIALLGLLAKKRWGCHISDTVTAISFLDAGTAALLEQAGLKLVSAAGLLQRFKGLLDSAGMEAHERAACHLYEITGAAWAEVRRAFAVGADIHEGDIQRFMLTEFGRRGLVSDCPPLVAAGANSALPHYAIAGNGAAFEHGALVQFDLWAKEAGPEGVYADISWVGVFAEAAPPGPERAFGELVQAREGALHFIEDEFAAGRRPSGADVDRMVRAILAGFGHEDAIRHRTGHGIDTEVHGSGVNLDSFEFPDERLLLDGSCFSIEPGVYFAEYGIRTEIDVYIREGKPVVSGKERQFALLHC